MIIMILTLESMTDYKWSWWLLFKLLIIPVMMSEMMTMIKMNDYVGRLRTDGELGELLSIAIACCQKKL